MELMDFNVLICLTVADWKPGHKHNWGEHKLNSFSYYDCSQTLKSDKAKWTEMIKITSASSTFMLYTNVLHLRM